MKVHATPAPVTGAVYVEHAKALGPRRSIHPSWLAAGELDLVALRHLSRKLNTLLAKDMPFLQTKGPHCLIYGNCGIIAIMMTDALQRPKGEAIAQAPRIATIATPWVGSAPGKRSGSLKTFRQEGKQGDIAVLSAGIPPNDHAINVLHFGDRLVLVDLQRGAQIYPESSWAGRSLSSVTWLEPESD